jgi:hypothetical protein
MLATQPSPLEATHRVLRALAQLTEQMNAALAQFDFEAIDTLRSKTVSLRTQLTDTKQHMAGYAPQNNQELEMAREIRSLLQVISEGDRYFTLWKSDMQTFRKSNQQTLDNCLKNLPYLRTARPVGLLENAFKGRPAIIVSAGPSRDKQFPLIKAYQDRAVVMTLNRCVDAFIDQQLVPDLTLVTDPKEAIKVHMEHVTEETNPYMVLRASVHPEIFHKPALERFCYSDGSSHETGLLQALGIQEPDKLKGMSVAHASLFLAMKMGCSPIIMVGQDLAYTDDRLYAKSDQDDITIERSADEDLAMLHGSKRGDADPGNAVSLVEVPGFYGKPVASNALMARMVLYFETIMEEYDGDSLVINATEGGAFIRGMTHMPLEEALNTHCGETFDAKETIAAVAETYNAALSEPECVRFLEEFQQRIKRLMRNCNAAIKALSTAERTGRGMKRVKQLFAAISSDHDATGSLLADAALVERYRAHEEKRNKLGPYEEIRAEFRAIGRLASGVAPSLTEALRLFKVS